ncbi:CHAT domain-containing protein [Thiofilum flexile]|uniref:CHAT domain-containing protein n=1 Tax=Thiofilum flexile TaxID=125627 RepID=UPI000380D446|nr:CHAT domain-containing protein [Thiofilum flexile]
MSQLVLSGSVITTAYTLPIMTTTDLMDWTLLGQWSVSEGQERQLITLPTTALIQLEFNEGRSQYLSIAEAERRYQLDFTNPPPALVTLRVFQLEITHTTAPLTTLLNLEQQYARLGLYQFAPHLPFSLKPINSAPLIKRTQPVLLLFPDALQNLTDSFATWWEARPNYNPNSYLERLLRPYGQQVFGLQYSAFITHPLQTLQQLVQWLPQEVELHCIGYGVGGVLAELLAQGSQASWDNSLTELESAGAAELAKALKTLTQHLQSKQITVSKVVTLGAPLRGWGLVNLEFSELVSWLNAVQQQADPSATPNLDYRVTWLGLAVALKLIPSDLEGLLALQPHSDLIRLLNNPQTQLIGQAAQLVSHKQADTLDQWLADNISTLVSSEAYDGVVSLQAAYGGAQRSEGHYAYIAQGKTQHFNYGWDNSVLERIVSALQTPILDTYWQLPEPPKAAYRSAPIATMPATQGIAIFIPGLLGSELLVGENPVWLDESALHWGDFAKLTMSNAKVQVGAVISEHYTPWLEYLSTHYQVIPFAYDWRQATSVVVNQLATLLKSLLQERKQQGLSYPIRIVAHSAGGFIAWSLVQTEPLLWQRLTVEADTRILLLGAPLQGTAHIAQWLYSEERFIEYLSSVAGRNNQRETIATQLASYQGLVDLLPAEFLTPENWTDQLNKDATLQERLQSAQTLQNTINSGQSLSLDRIAYVQGESGLTPAQRSQEANWLATRSGDGVVTWRSVPSVLAQWRVPLEHGLMLNNARYFSAFTELLEQGHTTALERVLPTTASESLVRLPPYTLSLYPTIELIRAAAFGYHTLETRTTTLPPVDLWVTQGNLEHVSRILVVGHYEGNGIVSAESALDQRLNGRLRELHRLGIYPAALNTADLILNTGKQPAGALVIGLGEAGKLTTQALTQTFAQGLLRYAMSQMPMIHALGDAGHFTKALNISSLLIGTQASGLSLREGLLAILRAVQAANTALLKLAGSQTALRFQSLELVELYADKAIEAAKHLQELVQQGEFQNDFSLSSWVRNLPGGYSRVVYSEASGWWQRLQIIGGMQGLSFLVLTERARAEAILQPTQRQLVDQFVSKAINQATTAESCEVGKVLFEMLLPNALKEQTLHSEHWVLVLNSEAAAYPWELLQDRQDPDQIPLAVRTGLVRQLQTTQFRQVVLNPSGRSALVVGDPVLTLLPRLSAARQEAHSVANLLEQYGFNEVVREVESTAESIICALHNREVRVLHLAGHGVYHYNRGDGELVTGMVIGDNEFLTAVEIEQMRQVPELVFVNCCHLGKVDQEVSSLSQASTEERHQFAASFAESLIAMGVRVVIVAGWAISDLAARLFAETCYRALLTGCRFGDAVLQARRDTWRVYPNSNTWGAYQCYGDPDYRLVQSNALGEDSSEYSDVPQYIAPIEVSTELDNLINATDSLRLGEYQWLLNKVNLIAQVTPTDWLKEAGLLSRLGRVYSKLDQFPQALQAYKQALYAEKAEYLMSTWDDLVSVLTAYGLQLHQSPALLEHNPIATTAQELMAEALKILDWLDQLGQVVTPPPGFINGSTLGQPQNRLEERAKYFKRLSMMEQNEAQTHTLKLMEAAYWRAHSEFWNSKRQVAPYPLVNWLTCRLVRYHRQEQLLTEGDWGILTEWLARAEAEANSEEQHAPTFLTAVNQAEVLLVHYLMPDSQPNLATIIQYYEKALERGAPPRRIRFVSEHLEFLTVMLKQTVFVEAERQALQDLKGQLKQRWQLLPVNT